MNNPVGSGRSPDLSSRKQRYNEGYHFITIVTNKRVKVFKYKEIAKVSMETILFYDKRGDFRLIGFVIMPDHIHIVFDPIKSVSCIIRDIKKYIARETIKCLSVLDTGLLSIIQLSEPKKKGHIYQLWQKDFYDFNIISENKLNEKLKYMYENPVRKNLCGNIFDYEFSDVWRYFGSGDPKLP